MKNTTNTSKSTKKVAKKSTSKSTSATAEVQPRALPFEKKQVQSKDAWTWDFELTGIAGAKDTIWIDAKLDPEKKHYWHANFYSVAFNQLILSFECIGKWESWNQRVYLAKEGMKKIGHQNSFPYAGTVIVEPKKEPVAKKEEKADVVTDDLIKKICGKKLTSSEEEVFEAIYANEMACTSGDFGFIDEVLEGFNTKGISSQTVGGVITNLVKLKLIEVHQGDTDADGFVFEFSQVVITDKGWELVKEMQLETK